MQDRKAMFADILIEMLNSETLDKITVKDLVKQCGVSRQAFYYYFDDIYDVIEWIFMQETERALSQYSDINTWQFGYRLLLSWMKKNQKLVTNTYKSVQREYVETFMNRVLYPYIFRVVENQSRTLEVTTEQKAFVARFYTLAFNAISAEWLESGMKEAPEKIAERVEILVKGDFRKALKNFHEENKHQHTEEI